MPQTLTIGRHAHDLLWMDLYGEYPEGEHNPDPTLKPVRDELRAGRILTVTPQLTATLGELADRDQDTDEQRVYRKLYRRAKEAAHED